MMRSAATLEDRQELSVAWQGVRSSAALALTRTHTRRLDSVVSAADDLAGSNEVRLDGISVTLAHRLTPESSLSLALSNELPEEEGPQLAALLFDGEVPATAAQLTPVIAAPKVGRNEPCPCGSGNKFKRCCAA